MAARPRRPTLPDTLPLLHTLLQVLSRTLLQDTPLSLCPSRAGVDSTTLPPPSLLQDRSRSRVGVGSRRCLSRAAVTGSSPRPAVTGRSARPRTALACFSGGSRRIHPNSTALVSPLRSLSHFQALPTRPDSSQPRERVTARAHVTPPSLAGRRSSSSLESRSSRSSSPRWLSQASRHAPARRTNRAGTARTAAFTWGTGVR